MRKLLCGALLLAACSKSPAAAGPDAGPDAGPAPSSTDGGAASDAGADAGVDAGVDAGTLVAVLQHHNSGTRAGLYVDPAFTKAQVGQLQPAPGFSAPIQGPVFSQPLFLEAGTGGTDAVYVATEQDLVYAFDAQTGAILWQKSVGTPVPNSTFAPCGTIDPLGITGTPIIDLPSATLLLDAMTLQNGSPRHLIFALSLADGSISWQLDVQAQVAGFDSSVQNQRGALAIVDGVLYVPYGGLAGGCGNYHGWVVAVPLASPTSATGWHTGSLGAGMWGPSGVATDGTSIFVSTAENLPPASPIWADGNGEAILRLTAVPDFSGQPADYFAPKDWFSLQNGYSQLGSSGVVLLDLPGSTPSALAFAIGKTSNAYLVDRGDLGGETNGVAFLPAIAASWVEGALATYSTAKGSYVAMESPLTSCPLADVAVLQVLPGSPPTLAPGWCAIQGGAGSPIATASAPNRDVMVWGLGTPNQGATGSYLLTAFDGDTGAVLARSNNAMPDMEHWISPIVAKGRLYVAGDRQLYAYSLNGPPAPAPDGGDVGSADAGAPASCLVPVAPDQPDPCAPYGMACVGTQQDPFGSCAPPGLDQACLASVGCATPNLACLPLPAGSYCEQPCSASADCSDPFRTCQRVASSDAGVCLANSCGGPFFAGCDGGTCLPLFSDDGNAAGECYAAGGTEDGGCTGARSDAGTAGLCPPDSFCLVTSGTTGGCVAVCDAWSLLDGGGPGCASGLDCVSIGGFGLCAQPCTTSCPGGLQCLQVTETLSVCLP